MLGADLGLALTYVPLRDRGAVAGLFAIDRAMGDVVRTTTEPALGAIRLAWWRERLEGLDAGVPPPGEPRLSAIARQLLSRGVSGKELSQLEDAWLPLLEPFPWGEPQPRWDRGTRPGSASARPTCNWSWRPN